MPIVENTLRSKLERGGIAFSLNLTYSRLTSAAGIAKACGFDWLFIDTEHNTMNLDTVSQVCIAALPTGVTPVVRVPSHDPSQLSRVLDGGAMGVVVPHVDTVEQARSVVRACRFPPLGHRSLTAPCPQLGFEAHPVAEAIELLNRNTFVVVMLETPEAIERVDEIAAVDGVDALLIGSNDFAAACGVPGEFGHETVRTAYQRMIAACRRHGKFPGMGGIYDETLMERYIGMGVRLLLGGGDVAFMMAAARQRAAFLRGLDVS